MDNAALPSSDRTRIRRAADRGRYDHETLYAILDDAYVCHLAFADVRGTHCIPTACWRIDDQVYVHGSNGSQLLKAAAEGVQVCLTVTHLDGLVMARSAFNHSMNYRSALIYGVCEPLLAAEDKSAALDALMEKLAPGRAEEARRGNTKELAATTVLRLPLTEFACKIREGGPHDDEADLGLNVWAGVLPLTVGKSSPIRDASSHVAVTATPAYVSTWAGR